MSVLRPAPTGESGVLAALMRSGDQDVDLLAAILKGDAMASANLMRDDSAALLRVLLGEADEPPRRRPPGDPEQLALREAERARRGRIWPDGRSPR
jgi:hypothetical protein